MGLILYLKNMKIKEIFLGKKLSAVHYQAGFEIKSGINFHSDKELSLQIGYMKREKEYQIPPHYHKAKIRKISTTQEVLFVRKGLVECKIFCLEKNFKEEEKIILGEGDFLHLIANAHEFKMLEESEIIEIKQGPYLENDDKIFL